jgi:hypothetical protein
MDSENNILLVLTIVSFFLIIVGLSSIYYYRANTVWLVPSATTTTLPLSPSTRMMKNIYISRLEHPSSNNTNDYLSLYSRLDVISLPEPLKSSLLSITSDSDTTSTLNIDFQLLLDHSLPLYEFGEIPDLARFGYKFRAPDDLIPNHLVSSVALTGFDVVVDGGTGMSKYWDNTTKTFKIPMFNNVLKSVNYGETQIFIHLEV